MKKSKIIIPALGMLLLSTAASVSGTVAWFTTVSTAKAEITSFAVRKLGGDLDYAVTAGTGTKKVTDSDPKSAITLAGDQPALCDSSFDHLAVMDYKANSSATSFSPIETANNSGISDETKWAINGTDAAGHAMVTYYAVSWSYTFTYTFGGDTTPVNLYLDSQGSTATATKNDGSAIGSTGNQTYKGFRIAFMNQAASGTDSGRSVVWAKNQAAAQCKFIDSDTTVEYVDHDSNPATPKQAQYTNNGAYTGVNSSSAAGDLLDSTGLAPLAESDAGVATRADYLGQFTTTSNEITIKCVAWFEGTDPNVVNESEMDTVAAALNFYTRATAA